MLYTILVHNCETLSDEKLKTLTRPEIGDVFILDKLVRVKNSTPTCLAKNDKKEFIISPVHFADSGISLEKYFYSVFIIKNIISRKWKDKTIYCYEIERIISHYVRVKSTSRF